MRFFAIALLASTTLLATKVRNPTTRRLHEAGTVLSEIMSAPDKGIPHDLLEKASCVVVVPGLKKAAFVVGGQFGKGFITCRKGHTGWSAPAAVRIEGGSFGFQIGGAEIDVVLLVMNERGADRLLSSKFTLGGEGEVAAGPVGRSATAQTDAKMTAEILSWSRSRGIFAGISLAGATLRQDLDDNASLYGKKLENQEIVRGNVPSPKAAARLLRLLNQYPATS
jgi:lipid-binding SYLF domain-containing protein